MVQQFISIVNSLMVSFDVSFPLLSIVKFLPRVSAWICFPVGVSVSMYLVQSRIPGGIGAFSIKITFQPWSGMFHYMCIQVPLSYELLSTIISHTESHQGLCAHMNVDLVHFERRNFDYICHT